MNVLPFNKIYQENGVVWSNVQSVDPDKLLIKEPVVFTSTIYSWSRVTWEFPIRYDIIR